MRYIVTVVMCVVWCTVGCLAMYNFLSRTNRLMPQMVGEISEAYDAGTMTVQVFAGEQGRPEKCIFVKGEKGHVGMLGVGGEGGTGMICGNSVAVILPGHGGQSR